MTNEQLRDRYAYLKKQHRCTMCGKKDERTLDGFTRCAECSEYGKKYYKGYRKSEAGQLRRMEVKWEAKAQRLEEVRPCDYQQLALVYAFLRDIKDAIHSRRRWKDDR